MNKETAVITGANGFVGSHLVDFLLQKNVKIKCIVRKSSDLKWLENKNVELDFCGLNDVNLLSKSFENASYIFHIAGTVKANNQAGFDYGNIQLTEHVLKASVASKNSLKKIVITSSLAAAGPSGIGAPHTEKVVCNPVSEYGKSKLKQEVLAERYFKDLPIVIARPPVVYGERDTEVLEFFQAVNKGIIPMAGTKEKYLSTIYVKDLVEGLWQMAVSEQHSEVYFLSGIEEMNWTEFGQVAAKVLGKQARKLKIPHFVIKSLAFGGEIVGKFTKNMPALNLNKYQEIKQSAWTCSAEKAKADFGFLAKFTLEESLVNTIDWYKKNKWI